MVQKIFRQLYKVKWFFKNFRLINRDAFIINTPPNYYSDGLMVFNNCDCLEEPLFKKAYARSLTVNDWRGTDGSKFDMRWRYYMVCFFANHVCMSMCIYLKSSVSDK